MVEQPVFLPRQMTGIRYYSTRDNPQEKICPAINPARNSIPGIPMTNYYTMNTASD